MPSGASGRGREPDPGLWGVGVDVAATSLEAISGGGPKRTADLFSSQAGKGRGPCRPSRQTRGVRGEQLTLPHRWLEGVLKDEHRFAWWNGGKNVRCREQVGVGGPWLAAVGQGGLVRAMARSRRSVGVRPQHEGHDCPSRELPVLGLWGTHWAYEEAI